MFPLIDKQKTGMNLRRIMDKQGITAKNVQEYLGLGCVQSIYRWFNGQSMPTIDNLYALSELLSVPIDKLVCGSRKCSVSEASLEEYGVQERRMYVYYCKLNNPQVA